MSSDTNLATKWRPQTYADVVGQDIPKAVLKKIALADGIACRSIFLKGSWGSGKCVLGDTRVATSEGYKKIKDICNGEYGFTPYETSVETRVGNFKSSHWYKEKDCTVRVLNTECNYSFNGTAKHGILSYHNNSVGLHHIGDLLIGDTILIPKTVQGQFWKEEDFIYNHDFNYEELPESVYELCPISRHKIYEHLCSSTDVFLYLYSGKPKICKQLQELFSLDAFCATYFEQNGLARVFVPRSSFNPCNNKLYVNAVQVSNLIRAHRLSVSHELDDFGDKLATKVRATGYISEEEIAKYSDTYKSLPKCLQGLSNYYYLKILSDNFVNADVYDLSVPEVHEFYAQGTYNHNTTLSRIFASSMNCESFKKTGEVCNECAGCLETKASNSQVYFEYDATVAGNIDSIKALGDKLAYLPPKGMRRVVVFDEIHAASSSALNALLKMVEEGVPNTIFVFASTEDILPTLKSRSICLDITTIPKALITERLASIAEQESISIDDNSLDLIADKSLGHMRDALSLLQLYSLVGADALSTPIHLLQKFIFSVLKKDKVTANSILHEILKFPTTDISYALSNFLVKVFRSDVNSSLNVLVSKGIATKLFGFFYNPVARQAVKSEAGMELLLRSFIEKV